MRVLTTLIFGGFLALVSAQLYSETYRPQYHFTPAKGWINDPNGLLYHKGLYHMYYQYNPTGTVWGNISWGHATSSDLIHWKELPIALDAFTTPRLGSLKEFFFSGSAVSDVNNTSGFGNSTHPPLVAMYTSYYPKNITLPGNQSIRADTQAQSIAYSTDDGLTWTEYAGSPVLPAPPSPYEDQWQNFRDPFVFRYDQGGYWVLVVSLAQLHKLLIYTSHDLKNWKHVSEFGPVNSANGVWECPGMFALPLNGKQSQMKWVVAVGVQDGGPGFASESAVQYIIGDFDGQNFTADSDNVYNHYSGGANWMDYGPDFYAVASYNGLANDERVAIAWMSDWAYALVTPTSPWRSAMTVPRELSLKTVDGTARLISTPHPNLKTLDSTKAVYSKQLNSTSVGTMTLPVSGKTLDITLAFSPSSDSGQLGLTVRSDGKGNGTTIGYDFPTSQMFVNRTTAGNTSFSPSFSGIYYAPLPATNGNVKLRILLDWSSVEVFGGQGESTITAQIFPPDANTGISLYSTGDANDVNIQVETVASVWKS